MKEAAVFGYVTAILVAVATVVFGFCQLEIGHADNAALGSGVGLVSDILLWSMSNWIAKENV